MLNFGPIQIFLLLSCSVTISMVAAIYAECDFSIDEDNDSYNCELLTIDDQAEILKSNYSSTNNLTEYVTIKKSIITKIPIHLLEAFPKLNGLLAEDCKDFIELNSKTFPTFQNLQFISIQRSNLTKISKKAFANLPKLEILKLSSNQIVSVDKDAFLDANSLIEIDLSENRIINLNDDTFAGLGKLRTLDLSKNSIEHVDIVLAASTSLKVFKLEGNDISIINPKLPYRKPKIFFDNLRNLKCPDGAQKKKIIVKHDYHLSNCFANYFSDSDNLFDFMTSLANYFDRTEQIELALFNYTVIGGLILAGWLFLISLIVCCQRKKYSIAPPHPLEVKEEDVYEDGDNKLLDTELDDAGHPIGEAENHYNRGPRKSKSDDMYGKDETEILYENLNKKLDDIENDQEKTPQENLNAMDEVLYVNEDADEVKLEMSDITPHDK